MRCWTWSLEVGVLVVAFLIATRTTVAAETVTGASITPIESARAGSLFERLTSPLASARASASQPVQTVAILPRTSITFPKKSGFRPSAPNIHTHPPKKSKLWHPFRKK